MFRHNRLLISSLLSLAILPVHAQAPVVIQADSPDLHVLKRTTPVYPPIARSARVTGAVTLQIEIGPDGSVKAASPLGGPAMLRGAASDCVRQWQYQPILIDGRPSTVSIIVTVDFNLPGVQQTADAGVASRLHSLQQSCIQAVTTRVDPALQAELCRQAADAAEGLGPNAHFIERRMAFTYASMAYSRNKQVKEALLYADKTIAVTEEKDVENGSGPPGAYVNRAQIEASAGDLQKASDDLTKAEALARDVLDRMASRGQQQARQSYLQWLKGTFDFHAKILSAMGKPAEASAKAAEGAKL